MPRGSATRHTAGPDNEGETLKDNGCYDCARCTGRLELSRGIGRDSEERRRLARTCHECGHVLHLHFHATLRALGWRPTPETLPAERPPRESPLGQDLVAHGQYDSYFADLRRDPIDMEDSS